MKTKLPALLLLAACIPPAYAESTVPLGNLVDVEAALQRGAEVSVTVDLSQCAPAGGTKTPGTTRGGLKIGAYRITPDGTLSFADEHATVDQDGLPIWQFIRYQVKPNDTVAFSTDLFSLPSYTRLMPRIAYSCAINQGIAFFTDRH